MIFTKPNISKASKVEINLNKNEVAINFILNENINALYITNNGINSLIILDYKKEEDIEKNLKKEMIENIHNLYTITPVIINLYGIKGEMYLCRTISKCS